MNTLFEAPAQTLWRKTSGRGVTDDGGRGPWADGRRNGDGAPGRQDLRHVAAGAFEATLTGRITDANSALAKLLGHACRQALLGSSLLHLLADRATLDRVLGHAREGQELIGEEVPLRTEQGDEVVVLLCTKLTGSAGGDDRRLVGTLMDITERKRREADFERLAFEDPLTGLANCRALDKHATKYLALAERRAALVGLLSLDLTGFKKINDRFGHAAGDAVLGEVARRLEGSARETDVVSRVGGDEFVVLLPEVEDLAAVISTARRMKGELEGTPFELGNTCTTVRAEIGIAAYPEHGSCLEDLVQVADQAMYRAKQTEGRTGAREDAGHPFPPIVAPTDGRTSPQRRAGG
ncbi:MAG: diguanylate cyclase [Gemmatimonadota bacterium]